jgi:hypothetical protein
MENFMEEWKKQEFDNNSELELKILQEKKKRDDSLNVIHKITKNIKNEYKLIIVSYVFLVILFLFKLDNVSILIGIVITWFYMNYAHFYYSKIKRLQRIDYDKNSILSILNLYSIEIKSFITVYRYFNYLAVFLIFPIFLFISKGLLLHKLKSILVSHTIDYNFIIWIFSSLIIYVIVTEIYTYFVYSKSIKHLDDLINEFSEE